MDAGCRKDRFDGGDGPFLNDGVTGFLAVAASQSSLRQDGRKVKSFAAGEPLLTGCVHHATVAARRFVWGAKDDLLLGLAGLHATGLPSASFARSRSSPVVVPQVLHGSAAPRPLNSLDILVAITLFLAQSISLLVVILGLRFSHVRLFNFSTVRGGAMLDTKGSAGAVIDACESN